MHNAGKVMSESHCPRCGAVLNAVATTTGVCSVCRLTLDPAAESIATSDVTRWPERERVSAPPKHTPLEPGRSFGSYRLLNLLGRGAFGAVWEAEHVATGRRVALKVLTATRGTSTEAIARFQREGRLAASINHPRCVFVFGAETIDGLPTVSMELMAGGTLQDAIESGGRIPARHAVDQILDVIDGLEAARAAGIIHRDVKPSNCFVDDRGAVKIGDFGISKTLEPDARLTQSEGFLGTPVYASPEQVRGRGVDFRSDIYSLGATLYAMLTGAPPFTGVGAVGEALARVLSEEPADITVHVPAVPKALARIVQRMMAKDRTKRYQDYASVRGALLPFSSHGMGPASLASRFAAYATDTLILWLPSTLVLWWIVGFDRMLALPIGWRLVAVFVNLSVCYFAFSEWYWGRSIGKYLFGLRVTTALGLPPSFPQALGRILILSSFRSVPDLLFQTFHAGFSPYWPIVAFALAFLPWATMRRSNGFAGVHELLTETRIMVITTSDAIAVPSSGDTGVALDQLQTLIGPYRPTRVVWSTADEALLIAVDEVLRRTAWIHRFAEAARGRATTSLAQVRPHRLRWLTGSLAPEGGWDAYEAPSGTSLANWVKQEGTLTWQALQPLLVELSAEFTRLDAAAQTHALSVAHVWVDRYGDVKLLDFPATSCDADLLFEPNSDFLFHLAVFCLEGRLVAAPQLGSEPPQLPMPDGARAVMKSLAARAPLPELCAELQGIAARPTVVTRGRRLGPLLAAAVVPGMVALVPLAATLTMWVSSGTSFGKLLDSTVELQRLQRDERRGMGIPPGLIAAHERIVAANYATLKGTPAAERMAPNLIEQFEAALNHYPVVSASDLEAAERLVGSVTSSQSIHSVEFASLQVAMILRIVAILAVVGVLLTYLFRGPLFWLSGITLQTRDGSRASRARHLARAAAEWAPFLIFLPTPAQPSLWLISKPWWFGGGGPWIPSVWLLAMPWTLAIWGTVMALVRPARGIPDLIVGTYLVPR